MHTRALKVVFEYLLTAVDRLIDWVVVCCYPSIEQNRISGGVVSVLASSAVDRLNQTKYYYFRICCFSANHAFRGKSKDSWLAFGIMFPNGARCQITDGCGSACTKKGNKACLLSTKRTTSSSHSMFSCRNCSFG